MISFLETQKTTCYQLTEQQKTIIVWETETSLGFSIMIICPIIMYDGFFFLSKHGTKQVLLTGTEIMMLITYFVPGLQQRFNYTQNQSGVDKTVDPEL